MADFIVNSGLQVATNLTVGSYSISNIAPVSNSIIVSGNIGIGTSTPSQTLDVNGSALFRSNVRISSTASSTSTSTGALVVSGGAGIAGNIYAATLNPTSSLVPATGVYLPSTNTLGFSTSSGEKVRINANGNVGINTTSPQNRLHVTGNIQITNSSVISGIVFADGTFQNTASINAIPTTSAYAKYSYTATTNQTTFTAYYTIGYVDVWLNGAKLGTADYTATTGTNIVLATGANANSLVEVIAWNTAGLGGTGPTGPQGIVGPTGPASTVTGPTGPNFLGYTPVNKAGDTMFGSLGISPATNAELFLTKGSSGNVSRIYGSVGASPRWVMDLGDDTAETGGVTGSRFRLGRYNDSSGYLGDAISIDRSSAAVSFSGPLFTGGSSMQIASYTGSSLLFLSKPSSGNSTSISGGVNAGLYRWKLNLGDSATETGIGDGSNLSFDRYSDAGTYISTPITVSRLSGNVGVNTSTPIDNVQVNGGITANSYNSGQLAGFRNVVINGNFDIWQRGTSFSFTSGSIYSADRWLTVGNGSGQVGTISQQLFTPGQTDVPGEPAYFLRHAVTTAPTGQTYGGLIQNIEGVRTFAGQKVTVSFYAKAATTMTLPYVQLCQIFGTGGSPSATTYNNVATSITIPTTWQKFSFTYTLPSISGKTIGTNGDDLLQLVFNLPQNTTYTFDLASVQVELGAVSTPFERKTLAIETLLCQRYYQVLSRISVFRAAPGGHFGGGVTTATFLTKMRAFPSLSLEYISGTTNTPIYSVTNSSVTIWFVSGSTVGDYSVYNVLLNAELQ